MNTNLQMCQVKRCIVLKFAFLKQYNNVEFICNCIKNNLYAVNDVLLPSILSWPRCEWHYFPFMVWLHLPTCKFLVYILLFCSPTLLMHPTHISILMLVLKTKYDNDDYDLFAALSSLVYNGTVTWMSRNSLQIETLHPRCSWHCKQITWLLLTAAFAT